jgi:eukaryotic-like serine/threonine-protein kinase
LGDSLVCRGSFRFRSDRLRPVEWLTQPKRNAKVNIGHNFIQPERWRQIDQLFHLALDKQSDERELFLAEFCAGDEVLQKEVQELILSHEQAEEFIESPASDLAAEVLGKGQAGLKLGDKIGPYEIQSVLGIGGMGEVYLASDTRLGRQVALKILPPRFTLDPERVRRFEKEARAASALNHPNIVTIHEIGHFNNARFIVTEFVEGHTLRQLMNEKPFTLNEALNVTIQVAVALTSAHTAGIVHRDIKPENIMLRADGYVKILDFGLAKLTERQTSDSDPETPTLLQSNPGLLMGTVQYMSPEQARRRNVDLRTDVWSLGIVLYELLTGRVPFSGETPSHVMVSLMDDELLPLTTYAQVPIELDRVVAKALRKNKKERYQTARELAHDLKELKRELQLQGRLKQSVQTDEHLVSGVQHAEAKDRKSETTNETAANDELVPAAPLARNRPTNYSYLLTGLILVVVLIISTVFLRSWFTRSKSLGADAPVLSAPFSSEKLSTNGQVVNAVISPDGKNVVYTNGIKGKESVWLRQLESTNNKEIIPLSDGVYGRLAFSPDGNSFYFTRRPRKGGGFNIYRVSIFGGIPTKIVNVAQGWISISPDGGKVSFVRCYYLEDEYCSLWIADTDGSNERKLISRPRPIRIGDNQISPDGKTVAFAAGQSRNAANEFGLLEVNIENGAERELTTQKFFNIHSLAWLPNQSGLLIAASRIPNRNFRLWQVSAATGDASPMTQDSESYGQLSLDKAASVIVATQTKGDFNLLLFNRENPSNKRILADATQGRFAPDGKIIFSSLMSGNKEIWSINGDGSEQRQLTNDAADDSTPVSSPDNRFIFFVSNRTGEAQVWRMNADGSNQTQITVKGGGSPIFVSPDGRWVYYHHALQGTLWRVSTKGGEEQLVLDKEKRRFAFSPDGSRVAFSEKRVGATSLVIVSLADGRIIKTFTYADKFAHQGEGLELGWLPDGKSLVYILADNEFDNYTLWLQPLDAETPQRITDLGEDEISSLAVSPDGKSFAVVQGRWKADAVLIRGLR